MIEGACLAAKTRPILRITLVLMDSAASCLRHAPRSSRDILAAANINSLKGLIPSRAIREHWRSMRRAPGRYDAEQVGRFSDTTIAYYDRCARAFWNGTRDHNVNQNYAAFLDAIEGDPPYSILDLGRGPGRDLSYFRSLGHEAIGLDGSRQFVAMARSHSQCEVLQQDFLAMQLPESRFDGVFANASLFHIPSQEMPKVLLELLKTLKPRGVLFSSNPRGNNEEGLSDGRYACFFDLDTWRDYVTSAGFVELDHYYRPAGRPGGRQPWLATVWRKA